MLESKVIQLINSKLPSLLVLHLLVFKLIKQSSDHTNLVFLTVLPVELDLIMLLPQLVMVMLMVKITTLLETHGELAGVNKDMLESLLSKVQVSVVSKSNLSELVQIEKSNKRTFT